MKRKNLSAVIGGFVILIVSGVAVAQLMGTQLVEGNMWFKTNNKVKFGAPNAEAYYNGTNLVLDVTSGGGKVSMPDGIDTGTANMSVASSIIFEGATADAFETTLAVTDTTTPDKTVTIPDQTGAVILSVGGVADAASAISGGTGTLVFEGTTANGFETTLGVVDPTADQTFSIPNFAVSAAFLGSTLTTNTVDAANSVWGISNGLVFEGATADGFETTLSPADPGADKTVTIPAATGDMLVGGNITITAGANTACNTTCGSAAKCIVGQDAGASNVFVACATATADVCVCAN